VPAVALLTVVILITLSGVPTVNIQIPVTVGVNTVELPVTPIEASIAVTVNGAPAPYLLNGSTLYIVSDVDGVADINYVANINVADSRIVSFNVSEAYVKLYIPDNVVLLTPPSNISALSLEVINGTRYTVVEFYGPQTVEYMVLNTSTPTDTTPTSTTILTQATPTTVVTPFTQTSTTYTIGTTTSTQTQYTSPLTAISAPQTMSPSPTPSIPTPVPEATTTATIITSAATTSRITTTPTTQQIAQTTTSPQTGTLTGVVSRDLTTYIIAAIVVIVLVIAVVLLLRRRFV